MDTSELFLEVQEPVEVDVREDYPLKFLFHLIKSWLNPGAMADIVVVIMNLLFACPVSDLSAVFSTDGFKMYFTV